MSKMSSEEYLNSKLKPLFNSLTENIIKDQPENPALFIINWLKNYTGYSNEMGDSAEKKELIELRKEIKKLKKKYDSTINEDEELVASASEDEHDEEDDKIDELLEQKRVSKLGKGPRTSVSAEVYGSFNIKQAFVPKVIPKSEEQILRIQTKVLNSFIFNNLDEKELKTVVDAMEEFTCVEGDVIIQQGDPGAVLFIIEKGNYDCFKQFVSYILNNFFRLKIKGL